MKASAKANFEKPITIIGEDTVIEGALLKAKKSIRINGTYKGSIEVDGSIVVGDTGIVQGNIKADFIYVAGKVEGNIDVTKLAHLSSQCNVKGDILCGVIVIDEGALLEGNCKMKPSAEKDSKKNLEKSV
jgi:cytoskeletal protein CcmA (bactofilin family)